MAAALARVDIGCSERVAVGCGAPIAAAAADRVAAVLLMVDFTEWSLLLSVVGGEMIGSLRALDLRVLTLCCQPSLSLAMVTNSDQLSVWGASIRMSPS